MSLSEKVKTEISTNGIVLKDTMMEIWELSQKVDIVTKKYNMTVTHISKKEDHHLVLYCRELELMLQLCCEESMEKTRNAKVIT